MRFINNIVKNSTEIPTENINFNELNIKVFKDGDMYCAMIGKDIQTGIAEFDKDAVKSIRILCDELDKRIYS